MAPKDRAPASTMDRAGIYVDRARTSPEQALAARIKALGVTPEQVRAWAEREGIPVPRYGVDNIAVAEYELAHPGATPIPPVSEPEETPCPTPTPAPTPAPAPKPAKPRKARSAATATSTTPSSAPGPPTPATSTATDSATSGPAPTPTSTPPEPGPTAQGARRAADRYTITRPTIEVPVDGTDDVIHWPHPHRQAAVNLLPDTPPAPAPATPAIDVPGALAAARRLGATGAHVRTVVRRLVALGDHLNDRLAAGGPWTCHVCQQPVAGEHVARTGRAIHGDPATLSGCHAAHTGRKTA